MPHNYYSFSVRDSAGEHPVLYLEAPWGRDKAECRACAGKAAETAARLMEHGYVVFCPLVHAVELARHTQGCFYHAPVLEAVLMERADALVVLNLPGAFTDFRTQRAVDQAVRLHIPVNLATPGELIAAHLQGDLAVEADVPAELWMPAHTGKGA